MLSWPHRQFFFFFSWFFVSLVNFSYWSRSHVNIITGSGVITIFFYKRLTSNPKIRNNPVWVFPNIWRLGQVRDTKLCTNFSNQMWVNAAKCQGYSFYFFWVIKVRPTGGGGRVKLPPPRLGVKGWLHGLTSPHPD